ncbi:MAG: restriction endonuclease subunit S [Ruminococcus sp.]|nr:restriction endonuclease subunit S [Ruminococcus sp.]
MTPKTKKKIEQIQNGETPNGYKFTDVGILPDNWGCARLSDISEQITQTAGTEKYETVSISAGIGFVNQAKKFGKELSGKQYAKYTVLHKGDFSYNKGNSKKYPQGCVYRLKDRETAAVPNVFESFRITTGCSEYYDQLFVSGYLNHHLYRLINHGVRDDGLLNLTHKDFYSCLLPVPPIEEQKKIAKILSAQDTVIECYEKKIEQLKRMKKYYLQNMFPKRGESVPKIRFKGFPDPWEQQKLADIYQKIGNAFVGTATPYYVKNGHFYLESNNVKDGQINYTTKVFINDEFYENQKDKWLHTGDIVMVQSGHVGHAAVIPKELDNTAAHALIMFRNPKTKIEPYFLNYQYQTNNAKKKIESITTGNTIKHILASDMQEFVVDVTSYEEQSNIVGVFQRLDTLITLHQRKLEEEKKKKKALQQLLLTGIVRTN